MNSAEIKAGYPERRWCRSAAAAAHRTSRIRSGAGGAAGGAARRVRKALATRRCAVLQDLPRPDDRPRRQCGRPSGSGEKIRAVIDDPQVADILVPDDHPIGAKRICTDSNYFQTFNSPHVQLVSVRRTPITAIDATGIVTTEAHFDLDVIVFATGFDALTGSLGKIDIAGRGESGWPTTGPRGRAPCLGWATTASRTCS